MAALQDLMSNAPNSRVEVRVLIRSVPDALASSSGDATEFQDLRREHATLVQVTEGQAAPLVRVLSELLLNAEKHAAAAHPSRSVHLDAAGTDIRISVRHRIDAVAASARRWETGPSGLALVQSLLESLDFRLDMTIQGEQWVAGFSLHCVHGPST